MNTKIKPKYIHDCDGCIYLGTVLAVSNNQKDIDCYWCANTKDQSLSAIIGRYSDDGPDYASSHPPEAFAETYKSIGGKMIAVKDYLTVADRWYLFSLLQATKLGLYKFNEQV